MISPIRWHEAQNKYSEFIVSRMLPKKNYYEPFLGGGSVLLKALTHQKFENYFVSDANENLIKIWNIIKTSPYSLIMNYNQYYNILNKTSEFFTQLQNEFNNDNDPIKYFFLSRNSNPRYLSPTKNELKLKPSKHPGISPQYLEKIILSANYLITRNNVIFSYSNYTDIQYEEDNLIYLHPPSKDKDFNYGVFFDYLIKLNRENKNYCFNLKNPVGVTNDFYQESWEIQKGIRFVSDDKIIKNKSDYFFTNYKTR